MKKLFLISGAAIILDQFIKICISFFMNLNDSIIILKDFFNISYVHNTGAAWSILSGNRWLLIIIGVLALNLIYYFFIYKKDLNKLELISYGLLIGGIIGNLIDRILYGYVIDYLDFNIFGYGFPVFNLADILICVSVFLIIILVLKEGVKNE